MLVLKPFTEDHGRSMVHLADPTCYFHYASWVFHPPARIHVRLLGPCFKTGHLVAFRQHRLYLGPSHGISEATANRFIPRLEPMLASAQKIALPPWRSLHPEHTQSHQTLPPQQFQLLLTLFSKWFSTFPRGTCSLSVSCQYLALEGIYLQIRAAFPNNPTL